MLFKVKVSLVVLAGLVLTLFFMEPTSAKPLQGIPTFSKVFSPATIGPGSVSTPTFTIDIADTLEPYEAYNADLPPLRQSNGSLQIYVWHNGTWEAQGSLDFDKFYRERQIELDLDGNNSGPIRLKLIKEGGGSAHLDAAFLGGQPPSGLFPESAMGLAKLATKDLDVLHGFEHAIELNFDDPGNADVLSLTARIEAERLNEIPFQLPLSNMMQIMRPDVDFWSYELGSNRGSLADSLNFEAIAAQAPFFKEFLQVGSGHPSDSAYGWVLNDDHNLYVVIDFTSDNTMDGEKDYAKVYVNTPLGLKSFKITQSDNQWGEPYFVYTDKVAYQHKVYAFRLPLEAVGLSDPEDGATLQLAFAVYGTAAPSNISFSKAFLPSTIGPGSVSTIQFDIDNQLNAAPVTTITFVDNLPAAITIADPPSASTTCPSGVITATSGGSTIEFGDGAIGAFGICTVTVNVTASTSGAHTNPIITLNSSEAPSDSSAVDLTVDLARPGFSKSFSPSTIPIGGRSTLTFVISNTLNGSAATNLIFTDNLPTGMVIADPANAVDNCNGTLSATPGSGSISFSSGSVGVGATCTVSGDVTASAAGVFVNTSGELLSNPLFGSQVSSGKATAALTVTTAELTLVKSFIDDPTPPGEIATLAFTITNRNRLTPATTVVFSDSLETTLTGLAPSGGLPATPCGGGSSLSFGTGTLSLNGGGPLAADGGFCTFTVTLQIPGGAVPGPYPNTTSLVSGNIGTPVVGTAGQDTLFVQPIPILTKEFTDDPAVSGGTVTLLFTVTNSSPITNMTAIAFEDSLPTILATKTPAAVINTCGGTATFTPLINPSPPSSAIPARVSLSGGGPLTAGASCTVSLILNVNNDATLGNYLNTTDPPTGVVDTVTYTGKAASDTLMVVGAPEFRKTFTSTLVAPGGPVGLVFELEHSALASTDATNISFTDNLDTNFLSGVTASGLPQNNICGTGSQITGTTALSFTGGTLAPGSSCVFTVPLQIPAGATPGTHTNTAGNITATVSGFNTTGNAATADLTVAGLTLSKEFTDDPVIPGGTVTLRFTLDNTTGTQDATSVGFQDDLATALSGLTAPAGFPTTPCNGTLAASAGDTILDFSGGTILSGTACSFDVTLNVSAVAAEGSHGNSTTSFRAKIGGGPLTGFLNAQDNLIVVKEVLQFSKTFVPNSAFAGNNVTLVFSITNSFTSATASNIGFTDNLTAALSGLSAIGLPAPACGGTLSGSTNLTFSAGSLAGGAFCQFSVTLTISAVITAGDYTNTVDDIAGTIGLLPITGNTASDDITVVDPATAGRLIIDKVTAPAGDATSFNFSVRGSPLTFTVQSFSLTDGATPKVIIAPAGVYAITETVLAGWTLDSTACSNSDPVSGVTLGAGQVVTCTFNNLSDSFVGDIYLPIIFKDASPLPDLIITSLVATTSGVTVTIQNVGYTASLPDFWVDVYFNPTQIPGLNKPWQTIAPAGAVWGVSQPLAAGEVLTLIVGGTYYDASSSSSSFPSGASVYGYVDSIDYNTTYGSVFESDESNNLFGPVMSTAGVAVPVSVGDSSISSERLPKR